MVYVRITNCDLHTCEVNRPVETCADPEVNVQRDKSALVRVENFIWCVRARYDRYESNEKLLKYIVMKM